MSDQKRSLALLFATLVIVMMGFGMVIPIMPFYVDYFGATGSTLGLLMASYAAMQFLFSPFWGSISDRWGRKPVLMLGIFGFGITMVFFGLSTELWMLFAARILSGVLSSATMPTAMAFIGDSTDEDSRGGGMGLMGAAMGVGMVIGPGLGGWLASQSLSTPFFLAGGLAMLSFLLVGLLLPESLPADQRTQSAKLDLADQFSGMWRGLFGPIGFLLVLAFLLSFALTNFEGVFGLYSLYRFDYGPKQVGSVLTVIGLISAIVQGALTGPVTKKWGESAVIKASLFFSAVGYILMLVAFDVITVYLTVGFFVLANAMLRPAVSSLTSKRSDLGQGTAMGLNNAFMSLGRVAGPITAGALLDIKLSYPYSFGAVTMLFGFILCMFFLEKRSLPNIAVEEV